jgi:hypothetical protein
LQRLLARLSRGHFEIAENFVFIPCFASRDSLFQGKQGITAQVPESIKVLDAIMSLFAQDGRKFPVFARHT